MLRNWSPAVSEIISEAVEKIVHAPDCSRREYTIYMRRDHDGMRHAVGCQCGGLMEIPKESLAIKDPVRIVVDG